MSRFCVTSGPLSDRTWRSGHPFRPRCGRCRRVAMSLLLLLLAGLIFGYNYVTDADRVRGLAEVYLSRLIRGRVSVDSATLSIFEGLRVGGVRVYVDDGRKPDSLLFSAQTFVLNYDPAKLLVGQIEAAQIIAQKPHVHLTQDAETGKWNVERLIKSHALFQPSAPTTPGKPPPLPELLLRNARVEIGTLRDGVVTPVGYEALDGQLTPMPEIGSFGFDLQTRGKDGIGPWASGTASLGSGATDVELHDLNFDRDVRSVLWADVRDFWERHGLAGRIKTLRVHYQPAQGALKEPAFRAEMVLNGVNITVPPADWLSAADVKHRAHLREAIATMQSMYALAGYRRKPGGGAKGRAGDGARDATELQLGAYGSPDGIYAAPTDVPARFGALDNASSPARPFAPSPLLPLAPSPPAFIAAMTEAAPINLEKGSGTFVFTQAGVDVQDVTGRVEGNAFNINGHLTGYSPDAPFSVRIKSLPGDTLKIPASPPYLNAMPGIVREIYSLMRPDGICTMAVRVDRPTPGSRPLIDGQVEVVDGTFATIFFPYTLRQVHGQVAFGWNESAQADFVRIVNMRGRGNADGPNRDKWLAVNGEVGPLGPGISDPHVEIRIDGKNIESEPPLMAAFPPEVKGPLKLFDADHTGRSPTFRGDFHTTVLHHAGASWRWTFDTDVNIHDASGKLVGFPYPLEHVAARLQVRDGYLDVIDARMVRDGSTTMRVDGRVSWGAMTPPHSPPSQDGVRADLKVAVRDLAIDKELLAALPPEAGARIKSIGIGGRIDVDGHVFTGANDPARPAGAPFSGDDVRFDLGVALRHGTMWPAEGTFSASDVSGRFHLTRDAIEILAMHGRRGAGELDAEGAITSPGGEPEVALHVKAKALPLDGPLYALLPATARRAWDEVQPQGGVDAEVTYRGPVGGDPPRRDDAIAGGPAPTLGGLDAPAHSTAPPSTPSAPGAIALSPASMVGAAPPASIAPAPHAVDRTSASIPSGFRVTLKPRGLACTIKSVPYALHDLTGTINVTPEGVTITDVSARHGDATITVSGTGSTAEHPVWDLKLSGKHVPVDDDLRKALPAGMLSVVDAVKLRGNVDFDFPRFVYRGDGFLNGDAAATQPTPATTPATTAVASSRPAPCVTPPRPAEIDLASTINFNRCTLDLGVPLEDLGGQIRMAATVRDGRLAALRGDLDIAHVAMGTRHLTDFHTTLEKPADRTELYLDKMHGRLAGGNVAGQVHLSFPDVGPSKYVLAFVVRNADLQALVGDAERDIKGELTANMSLEGVWGDASLRRGRGDVIVTGKELYHIPLVMGLLQMTNLTLPIATPFKVGDARYSVAGQRVNFEQVQLKSDNMMMLGAGFLDFKSKQVRMTFTTDNPGGFKVPFLNDIWQGARGELFKLSIKGTIQEPKVEANPFATLTTTVDEVFKEDGKRK